MTTTTNTNQTRNLAWLTTGDVLNTGFVYLTFAGSVFVLFLDELGLDNAQIGFMLALIPFCGLIAPFIAPWVSRFGYKRTFVAFWGLRKFIFGLFLLTPLIITRFGEANLLYWSGFVIGGFGLARAIAETGSYPWMKEIIPDGIRGKFTAIDSMLTTIAGILVTLGASYIIDTQTGLGRFMLLITVGITLGLLGVGAYSRVPAEPAAARADAGVNHMAGMKTAVRDRRFIRFLFALGLASIGGSSIIAFVPLFMKEQIGLSDGIIVLLSIGTYVGSLLTSYLWGWTADRYGSKPIMQTSLLLTLILPIAWFLLPRQSNVSAPLAMVIAFLVGVATLAWQISWARYLYVNAIPTEQKAAYTAVYYAWFSLMNGLGPLLAGQLLNLSQNLQLRWLIFTIDPYTPLFALSVLILAITIFIISRLPEDNETSLKTFAGMFLRLNTVRSLGLLIRYYFADNEHQRMMTAEQMGATQNLLSAQELLEALADPSFNVRYEAIQAIGRMPAQPELVEALINVMGKPASELSSTAARALGRMGDQTAIPALRQGLVSGYWFLEANSARALAMLGDRESIPILREKLREAPTERFKLAFASALGKLQAEESIAELFDLLHHSRFLTDLPTAELPEDIHVLRGEIGLALARIIGDETYYLQQYRAFACGAETAVFQALHTLQKKAKRRHLRPHLTSISPGDEQKNVAALQQMLATLPSDTLSPTFQQFQQACLHGLDSYGATRQTFILLSLHTLNTWLKQTNGATT